MRPSIFVLAITAAVAASHASPAQEAIFLIRHAEKAAGEDPPITLDGQHRAARWANMLEDAGIEMVFTSTARCTRETGGIIANGLGVPTEAFPANEITMLMDTISFDHDEGRVLVVGHTETIPDMLTELGAFDLVDIADDDFARLFVVLPREESETVILQFRMP